MWLGSSAVGSLIGSIVSTATSGLQGIMGTATTAVGANVAKNQAISTAEEITAAVRRELTAGFDPNSIQKTLQSSLSGLQRTNLDLDKIGSQLAKSPSKPKPSTKKPLPRSPNICVKPTSKNSIQPGFKKISKPC